MSEVALTTIKVPIFLWTGVIAELRRRGQNRRESGAFLLGSQKGGTGKIKRVAYYDDLDGEAYRGGAIEFHNTGYSALWQLCRETALEVLCDVHTHPGANVGQSSIDRQHPMIAVAGHTGMIVPEFAHTSPWSLDHVGVYEYLGGYAWKTHVRGALARRVRLTLW